MPLPPVWRCELDCKRLVGLVWLALGLAVVQGADLPTPEGEDFFVTAPGFRQAGEPLTAAGDQTRTLRILVSDEATGRPSRCRINVIGPDGNYYHPPENPLSLYSFTGEWPNGKAKGNRREKAPYRYLGRFFYSTGESELAVPPGEYRIEVSKGFEHKPLVSQARVAKGKSSTVRVALSRTAAMSAERYFGGDLHLHLLRATDRDDETIFDLLEAEDIAYGTPLGYNEPAGPYSGFMEKLDYPQFRGLGEASIKSRGPITILSGQEYRSGQYGHLNLYLRDRLVLEGKSFNADDWPVYGLVGAETQAQGGFAIHAHGGYALELYADAALGTVNAVELLQFGVYRGIGLADWYHMLNSGYRFPCVGASDYPACRFLGDCRTYVRSELPKSSEDRPAFADWLKGASEGRSFVTTGPLLQLDVDGHAPGEIIEQAGPEPRTVTVRIRVRSEVTPVSHVDLVVNGSVQQSGEIPAAKRQGAWHTVTHQVALRDSSWIAARAWSTTPGGQPDAESHTNPVYVYRNGKKPYQQASLDAWVQRIDGQIEKHSQRKFAEKSKVLDYFQRARDLLLKIRQKGGLGIDDDPAQLAADMERDDPPALAADIARPDATDEELREFLKPVPATPPEEAVKAFEGIDGFHMELVAAEPLVYDPIAAAFDEDGNLYACEMRDYPYKPADGLDPIGSVRFLRDTDGDGRYDEAHVFADKLLWAAGVVPWKGGVFVAAPPDIWYFKDTDGDHVADVKRRVFTGFGTGNQQAMVNNLQMGMDHWIYGSTAGNGGLIRPGDQPDAPPVSVSGRDFRFDPVTEKFELVTGTIQFGNTFDDWGNRFVCSESQPLLQIVLPDHYLARNPFLPSPYGIQSLAPYPVPIFRISPIERWRQIRSSRRIAKNERAAASAGASHHVVDAAAGVMVYRGGAYPSEFYGQVFVGDGQNNLIHRRALVPDGVPFKS
ncbi:MAG: PVC-type heme-binding CxxCH protein, partial [Planctomycetales bacterium]